MNGRVMATFAVLSATAVWTAGPVGQTAHRVDWLTDGGDPQRSAS